MRRVGLQGGHPLGDGVQDGGLDARVVVQERRELPGAKDQQPTRGGRGHGRRAHDPGQQREFPEEATSADVADVRSIALDRDGAVHENVELGTVRPLRHEHLPGRDIHLVASTRDRLEVLAGQAGPELGLTQPGMTIVCGDSHTSTHGAFGALAFGIGTSGADQCRRSGAQANYAPWMPRFGDGSNTAVDAFRMTLDDPALRRLTVAWFAVNAGKWAFLVTTLVGAYEAGGAVAVGILGLARFVLPTLIAPFAGVPTVRWRPEAVLRAVIAIRTASIVLAIGVAALDLPVLLLYVVVALEASVGAFGRPLHMALLPAVARTPGQLIAANVTSSAAEGLGTFVGPALAGLLLVSTGPTGATIAVFVIYMIGVAAIARLDVPAVGRSDMSPSAVLGQLSAGVRALVDLPGPRLIVLGLGLQTLVRGLLTVLVVVAAIELLGMGEPGVGALNAALGLGGLGGAVVAIALTGRERLSPAFGLAMAGWGAPIAVIGLLVHPLVALVAMLAVGVSNALIDVSGFTLIQRTTPNASRIAVLGLIDSVANGGVAVGGVVASVLVEGLGIRGALIVSGLILPIGAVLFTPALRRMDEGGTGGARRAELVHGDPLFAPLSLATVEHLAASLVPVAFADGEWVMREGEPGLVYVIIDAGTVEVTRAGQTLRTIGPGNGIGEIALMQHVPRTASVRAVGPVIAFSLDRTSFLEAVTGHAGSRAAATSQVQARLTADTERPALH